MFIKNEIELTKTILTTTMNIEKEFPELSKYIEEMNVTIPKENLPEIDTATLKEYQNSLDTLLKNYKINHTPKK
ncbi:MAG: hypothetical protein NTZ59_14210 [Bacteroidetes bacterium]|nr:hypothetical protein [Bacteroidota bacterium]